MSSSILSISAPLHWIIKRTPSVFWQRRETRWIFYDYSKKNKMSDKLVFFIYSVKLNLDIFFYKIKKPTRGFKPIMLNKIIIYLFLSLFYFILPISFHHKLRLPFFFFSKSHLASKSNHEMVLNIYFNWSIMSVSHCSLNSCGPIKVWWINYY